MKKWLMVSILGVVLAVPVCGWPPVAAAASSHEELPAGVPKDFPFPAGADLTARTMQLSGAKQVTVSCTFSGRADAAYKKFKAYAAENGYEIRMENESGRRFSAGKGAVQGLVVRVSDMGSVNLATVTFVLPK